MVLISVMVLIVGCSVNNLKISPSTIEIMVSETKEYEITISNIAGIGSIEFKDINVESLTDTKGVVSFDPTKTKIEKTNLSSGESTKAKIYLTGEKYGSTTASLKITYSGGSKIFQIPITVNKPAISLFLQDYNTGTLKTGTPSQIYLLITNQDDTTYEHGKIEITTAEPDVELKSISGYTYHPINDGIEILSSIQPGSLRIPFIMTTTLPRGRDALEFRIKIRLLWSSLGDNYKLIQEREIPIRVEK